MTGATNHPTGATPAAIDKLMPKRAAFIKWAEGRALDVAEDRDAWGERKFRHSHVEAMWQGWFSAPGAAIVYPPDGTVAPFTVINLGSGQVKIGDSLHDGRLPALWFGKDGLGMGVEEVMNRKADAGETLAVVTFGNVEGLDVLVDVIQRIRALAFPSAPNPGDHEKTLGEQIVEMYCRGCTMKEVCSALNLEPAGVNSRIEKMRGQARLPWAKSSYAKNVDAIKSNLQKWRTFKALERAYRESLIEMVEP